MDVSEIVDKIYGIRDEIINGTINRDDGNMLSRKAVLLAAYKMSLGDELTSAKITHDQAKTNTKFKESTLTMKYKNSGLGVGEAKERAIIDNVEFIKTESDAYESYERLKNLYEDTDRLISTLQTRIKVLLSEREISRSNLQT
jgi:hypothetical protein